MVAAVLHLHEGARVALDAVDQRAARIAVTAMMSLTRLISAAEPCAPRLAASNFSSLPSTRSTSGMAANVCGSVCAAQPVTTICAPRLLALQPADRLPRLPHGFRRHRAGVDDDRVVETGARRLRADHFRLVGVEPAAEGDDLDAHDAADLGKQRRIEAALELELHRAGHQHVVVALAPFDRQVRRPAA